MNEYRYYVNFKTKKFAYTSSDKLAAEFIKQGFEHVATPNCSLQSHPGIRIVDKFAAVTKPTNLTDEVRAKIVTNFMRGILADDYGPGFRSQKYLDAAVASYERLSTEGTDREYWKQELSRCKRLAKFGANNIPWKHAKGRFAAKFDRFTRRTTEQVERALDRSQAELAGKIAAKLVAYVKARKDTTTPFNKIQIKKDLLAILNKLP